MFTSSSVCGSLWKLAIPPTIAARWITCVQPATAARASSSVAQVAGVDLAGLAHPGGRLALVGDAHLPRRVASRRRTTAAPIVPAPPVTSTRLTSGDRALVHGGEHAPGAGHVPGVDQQHALGQALEQALEARSGSVATTTASAPSSAASSGSDSAGHVRVVAGHVGQLALEQADELVGERVAHVVGVALEGQAEHRDLAVAQRAAEPRLQALDEEERHGLVHARDRPAACPGALERSSENVKSLRRQAPAVRPGRPSRRAGSRG